jgi:hypothetical protein
MKRYAFAAITAVLMIGGASAREVAFCDPGYDIQKVSGDKAVCQKMVTVRDDIGPRHCPPLTNYTGNQNNNDGGDLCDAAGGVLGAPPAILCEIDPAYAGRGAKTDMIKNARDRCYVNVQRPDFGNVKTRQE